MTELYDQIVTILKIIPCPPTQLSKLACPFNYAFCLSPQKVHNVMGLKNNNFTILNTLNTVPNLPNGEPIFKMCEMVEINLDIYILQMYRSSSINPYQVASIFKMLCPLNFSVP